LLIAVALVPVLFSNRA
jgi:hypothetical protein